MAAARSTAVRPAVHGEAKLSEKESFELRQYQKIIQICESITSRSGVTPHASTQPESFKYDGARKSQAHKPSTDGSKDKENATVDSLVSSIGNSVADKPAFNPIFLEKSGELVRAELRLRRQRLENALRDDVDQRRAAKANQPQHLPDIDLSEVLENALAMVEAIAPTEEVHNTESTTANAEVTSESVDDSTFYSSRHDTPESHMTSRTHNDSEAVYARNPIEQRIVSSRHKQTEANQPAGGNQAVPGLTYGNLSAAAPLASQTTVVPGLSNYVPPTQMSSLSDFTTGAGTSVDVPGRIGPQTSYQTQATSNLPLSEVDPEGSPYSPVLREHDLEPFAPQPTHPSSVSVLATSAQSQNASMGLRAEAAPAQVAALRHDANIAASSDSSSYEVRKKGKRKRRKGERMAGPENGSAPYIKPEPRSVSPVTAPSYIRPTKRQRQTRGELEQGAYNHGHGQPTPRGSVQHSAQPYLARSQSAMYGPSRSNMSRVYGPGVANNTNTVGESFDDGYRAFDRSVPSEVAIAYSPRLHPGQRPPPPMYHGTGAYAFPENPYGGHLDRERLAVFAEDASYMESQRPPFGRHAAPVYGAYGSEFIEQPYRLVRRAPGRGVEYGEFEELYEEHLPRQVSRYPGLDFYEDPNAHYEGYESRYLPPRRVVTQPPPYAAEDYRAAEPLDRLMRTGEGSRVYGRTVGSQELRAAAEAEIGTQATSSRPAGPTTIVSDRQHLTRAAAAQPYQMASTHQGEAIDADDDFQESGGPYAARPIRRVQSVVHGDPRIAQMHYRASSNLNASTALNYYAPSQPVYVPSPSISTRLQRPRPPD